MEEPVNQSRAIATEVPFMGLQISDEGIARGVRRDVIPSDPEP